MDVERADLDWLTCRATTYSGERQVVIVSVAGADKLRCMYETCTSMVRPTHKRSRLHFVRGSRVEAARVAEESKSHFEAGRCSDSTGFSARHLIDVGKRRNDDEHEKKRTEKY